MKIGFTLRTKMFGTVGLYLIKHCILTFNKKLVGGTTLSPSFPPSGTWTFYLLNKLPVPNILVPSEFKRKCYELENLRQPRGCPVPASLYPFPTKNVGTHFVKGLLLKTLIGAIFIASLSNPDPYRVYNYINLQNITKFINSH